MWGREGGGKETNSQPQIGIFPTSSTPSIDTRTTTQPGARLCPAWSPHPPTRRPPPTAPPPRPPPPRVKLVLLGDSGVGKSCLALRLARGEFDPASAVTVGAAFMSTTVPCGGEGRPVRLDVS